jgi:hypothetical protein
MARTEISHLPMKHIQQFNQQNHCHYRLARKSAIGEFQLSENRTSLLECAAFLLPGLL